MSKDRYDRHGRLKTGHGSSPIPQPGYERSPELRALHSLHEPSITVQMAGQGTVSVFGRLFGWSPGAELAAHNAWNRSGNVIVVGADYSVIEARMLAHYAGETTETEDPWRRAAAKVLGIPHGDVTEAQRKATKSAVYQILYSNDELEGSTPAQLLGRPIHMVHALLNEGEGK
jgi:hypothetical protein